MRWSSSERLKKRKAAWTSGNMWLSSAGETPRWIRPEPAKRTKGVETVSLVYRRTKRYMPADEEELLLAVEDGVEFKELLAPVRQEDGRLICRVRKLGDFDDSGRRV